MIYFVGNENAFRSNVQCTIEQVREYCASKSVLGVDTETEGLDFLTKKMIMFQIGDEETQFVIDTRYVSIEPLREILEDPTKVKIFHNVKFDYKFIKKWANIEVQGIYDTMLAEQVLNTGRSGYGYGLTRLTERYCDVTLDKEVRNKFVGQDGKPFTESQIQYGGKDVEHLCTIRLKQWEQIGNYNLSDVVDLENGAAIALAETEYNGIGINQEAWLKLKNDAVEAREKLASELDEIILNTPKLEKFVCSAFQTDMFVSDEEIRKVSVSWSSPSQVLEVLKTYGLPVESAGAPELYPHIKHLIVAKYIKYGAQKKLATSYGEDFLKNVGRDGRIHSSFFQILETGRMSSSKPNMQQIPADNKYRNCFVPGVEDYVYVSSDYSSQELNVIAFGSQDPVWLKALEEGKDLHSVCADLVYGEKWTSVAELGCNYMEDQSKCSCKAHKKLRTNVKAINFGLAYGMGASKLATKLEISKEAASALIAEYFKAFPKIEYFLESLGNYGTRYGHIKTYAPYRRMRWFPEWEELRDFGARDRFKVLGDIERASKNTPIQGSSADMTKLALCKIHRFIKERKVPVQIVMTVHDQIDTIVHKDYAEEWKEVMTGLMEDAAKVIITNGLLKADTNISETWEK